MTKHDRNQLIELGVETLADTLLNLCQISPEANNTVKRLLATPKENIKRYKDKLARFKRSSKFIDWHESAHFAEELKQLLQDLAAGVQDPYLGTELVSRFFELDSSIFERCDDSNGEIGDVFKYDACNLFIQFANQCEDKAKIAQLVITLNQEDGYGVRDSLIDSASEYLPETTLRFMADSLWNLLENENNESQKRQWRSALQSIAKQLNDAILFENAALTNEKLYSALWLDVASVYFASGKPDIALIRLNNVPKDETFQREERNQLYLNIYHALGDLTAETDMAWQIFNAKRNLTTLSQLLDIIGHEQRESVINGAIKTIFQEHGLCYPDADFLLQANAIDALESYLLQRVDQLNGSFYMCLVPLAQGLEKQHKYLISSLIYRALIDAILAKAQSKYYHHAAKYLKQVNQLEPLIDDWQTWNPHSVYLKNLHEQHKRKSAFWSKF
jgi:hypothetical protein